MSNTKLEWITQAISRLPKDKFEQVLLYVQQQFTPAVLDEGIFKDRTSRQLYPTSPHLVRGVPNRQNGLGNSQGRGCEEEQEGELIVRREEMVEGVKYRHIIFWVYGNDKISVYCPSIAHCFTIDSKSEALQEMRRWYGEDGRFFIVYMSLGADINLSIDGTFSNVVFVKAQRVLHSWGQRTKLGESENLQIPILDSNEAGCVICMRLYHWFYKQVHDYEKLQMLISVV